MNDISATVLEESKVLQFNPKKKKQGQPIAKIVSHLWYINKKEKVKELVNYLTENKNIEAVGVVDDERKTVGIVIQQDLLSLMSRPYARQIFDKKQVGDVVTKTKSFKSDRNVFSISEEIEGELKAPKISYFLVQDGRGKFEGLFSTKDMLVYLSDMTRRDINLARQLQMRIVKESEYFDTINFEITASANPAKGVGGDYYAVKNYNDTNWIIALCDVSGKGVAASIITSVMWGMMNIFDFDRGLRQFLKELNDYLVNTFDAEKYVTAMFLDFNEETGYTRICDLGHSYLYNYRNDKLLRMKTNSTNLPLGILPDIDPEFNNFTLEKDDILFLLTDGIVEQVNVNNEEYAIDRIAAILRQNKNERLSSVRDSLLEDFHQFRTHMHLHDDITFLFLRYLKETSSKTER